MVLGSEEPRTFPSGQTMPQWACRCDCGKETIVLQSAIVSGRTKSCGCGMHSGGGRRAKDLSGQRFGDLEVIARLGSTSKGAPIWKCICNRCGRETEIEGHRLTSPSNPKKDCGCAWRERTADLTGERHGALEVIQLAGVSGHGDKTYLCRCAVCGGEKVFRAAVIKQRLKSCGCNQYDAARMKKMSACGVRKAIVNNVNVNSVFKTEATRNSQTGVRGVFPESGRPGLYRASVMVHGELWVRTGFTSIESARKARAEAQKKLIAKYGVKNPKEETE